MQITAFHGQFQIKQLYLDMAAAYRVSAEIDEDSPWPFTPPNVDHGYPAHKALEMDASLPAILNMLADMIHGQLSDAANNAWPSRYIAAAAPGADLSRVIWHFLHWLLTDERVNPGIVHPRIRDATRQSADVLRNFARGAPDYGAAESAAKREAWDQALYCGRKVWKSAESAKSAARSGELSAQNPQKSAALALNSAECAARSAERHGKIAESPKYTSERSDARATGRCMAFTLMADKIVELMA